MGDNDYEPNEGQDAGKRPKSEDDASASSARGSIDVDGAMDENVVNLEGGVDDMPADETAQAAITALQDEIDQLNDRLLRTAAELENTRRRAEKEKADANSYAISNFARDLLSVADNFERALSSAPEEPSEMSAEGFKGLITGVRMTEKELITTLERHGVERLDPTGEKFDPNRHQAVAQAPAAGVPSGFVAQTAQVGFVLGDRTLRAAMVIVSTGEPESDGSGGEGGGTANDPSSDDGPRVDTRV